jgi:ribosomal protein S12 methylthiotransferase accessory factor
MKAYYQTINRDLVLLDITSDSGIPVYAAVSRRLDRPVEDIITGFGAHLDPRIAASRAVTELNQSLPCVIRVSEQHPDAYVGGNRPAEHWWKNARISEYPFVSPAPDRPMAPIPERLSTGDLVGDISLCVERLARCGVEVLVLDQSRADIGLKVVRVMAPGLRPFWARFAPGRLYDVPVKMGERKRPLRESELNPFLVYF